MSVSKSSISKSIACGVSTIALSLGLAGPGLANPLLPGLTNLNFTQHDHLAKVLLRLLWLVRLDRWQWPHLH